MERNDYSFGSIDPYNRPNYITPQKVEKDRNEEITEIATDLLTEEYSSYISSLKNESKLQLKDIQAKLINEGLTQESFDTALNKVKEIVKENNIKKSEDPLNFLGNSYEEFVKQMPPGNIIRILYKGKEFNLGEFFLISKKEKIEKNEVIYDSIPATLAIKQKVQKILPKDVDVNDLFKYSTVTLVTKDNRYDLKELLKDNEKAFEAVTNIPYRIEIKSDSINYSYEKGRLVRLE
ncbi:hypothetical protein BN1013_02031 [Candidatus Rubidus massiliensis]|nr:hypothetical protein BN1013_02031 [Candidatus Rubidus massiliensis]